jgi:hypothetical protein
MTATWSQFVDDIGELFGDRCRADEEFARRLWGSLANVEWQNGEVGFGHTFRSAGAQIAEMRGNHEQYNYMEFYCSVPDGVVDPDVAEAFATRGWTPETDVAGWIGL